MNATIQLRDYQIDIAGRAAELIREHGMAYLSMQVRCGKTLTALQTAANLGASRVLFLSKLKALGSITADYHALGAGYELNAVNYEQLHNIKPEGVDLVICDEAHCLGQFPKPAGRAKDLKDRFGHLPFLYLSGTPTPESESQIYHQLWVCDRSPFAAYPNFYKWAKEYVEIKSRYVFNRQLNDYSCAIRAKIDAEISHLFLSYSQQEAGFTEDVQETIIKVPMLPATTGMATRLVKDRIVVGRDGGVILADTEVKLQQKLHQIFSGTVKVEDGTDRVFDRSKAEYIRDYLWRGGPEWDGYPTRKIAIFYKFVAEGKMLREVFGDHLTSGPETFAATDANTIFACQVQTGREGTNLSSADMLIMLNIDFAAVSYQQARARLQTKDRTKPCLLYWLFAEGGIEEKIYKAVQAKQDYTLRFFKRDFLKK